MHKTDKYMYIGKYEDLYFKRTYWHNSIENEDQNLFFFDNFQIK